MKLFLSKVKRFSIIVLLMFFTVGLFAQSPASLQNLTKDAVSISQVSPANGYFGATLSNQITGDNLADNFLFNANFLYNVNIGSKWKSPIIGEVSLPVSNNVEEISLGIFPWTFIKEGETSLVLHTGVDFSLVPGVEEVTPTRVRILGGVEGWFNVGDNGNLTVSLTPVVTFYNTERDTDYGLELTAIAPLTKGMGLVLDLHQSFRSGGETIVNAGVIIFGAL